MKSKTIHILFALFFGCVILSDAQVAELDMRDIFYNPITPSRMLPGRNDFVARDLVKIIAPTASNQTTYIRPTSDPESYAYIRTDHTIVPPMLPAGSDQTSSIIKYDVYQSPLAPGTNITPNTSLDFGYIEGSASVTPTGGASYTIPLEIPEGVLGVGPSLAIAYNSQSGNGLLGWGWDLMGISSISRVPQDYWHDLNVAPIGFNSSDRLAIDGNRMYPISAAGNILGTYNFTEGALYGTEDVDFRTIKEYNSGGSFPDHFIVSDKSGNQITYGGSDGSTVAINGTSPYEWRIKQYQDVNGNTINYEYTLVNGYSKISKIQYTGNINTGSQGTYTILFSYDQKTDNSYQYLNSSNRINFDAVLSRIDILNNGTGIKSYVFQYEYSGNITKLNTVIEAVGTNQLNPTKIIWSQNGNSSNLTQTTLSSSGTVNPTQVDYIVRTLLGDFNGDTYTDQVVFYQSLGWKVLINNGNGSYSDATPSPSSNGFASYSSMGFTPMYYPNSWPNNPQSYIEDYLNFAVYDYNNDGMDELIYLPMTGVTHVLSNNVTYTITKTYGTAIACYKWNGSGMSSISSPFSIATSYSASYSIPYSTYSTASIPYPSLGPIFQVGNFDGQGKNELLVFAPDQRDVLGSYNISVPTFGTAVLPANNANRMMYQVIDINGDGRHEVFSGVMGSTGALTNVNINYISNNGVVTPDPTINSIPELASNLGISPTFSDFNGDGKTDMMILNTGRTGYKIMYGNGLTFENLTNSTYASLLPFNGNFSSASGIFEFWGINQFLPYDFNKDGQLDFGLITAQQVQVPYVGLIKTGQANIQYYVNDRGNFTSTLPANTLLNNASTWYQISTSYNYFYTNSASSYLDDYNLDNLVDIVYMYTDGTGVASTFNYQYRNYIESITDGFGKKTSFTFDVLKPNIIGSPVQWYTPLSSTLAFPLQKFQGPLWVLRQITTPNVVEYLNSTKTITYSYSGGTSHLQGLGFLGFSSVNELDETKQIQTSSNYQINSTNYRVNLSSLIQTDVANSNFQIGVNTYSNVSYPIDQTVGSSNQAGRYFNYLSLVQSINNLTGETSSTTYNYDVTKGELNTQIEITGDQVNANDAQSVTIYHWNSYNSGTIRRIDKKDVNTQTTQTTGIVTASQTTNYNYTDGKLLQSISLGLVANPLNTTSYTYDGFGNVTKVTLHASDLPSSNDIVQTYTYDGNGLNVISQTDPAGAIQSFQYDPAFNRLTKQIDPGGLVTSYTYDTWGRITQISLPDNTVIKRSMGWSSIDRYYTRYQKLDIYNQPITPLLTTYYDILSRPMQKVTQSATDDSHSENIAINFTFNAKGWLSATTKPHSLLPGSSSKWIKYTYDNYGRVQLVQDKSNSSVTPTTTYEYPQVPIASGTRNFVQVDYPPSQTQLQKTVKTSFSSYGAIVNSISSASTTTYKYDGNGQIAGITNGGYAPTFTPDPDHYGMRQYAYDPYKGGYNYYYNGFNQITSQKHTKGGNFIWSYFTYDKLRLTNLTIGPSWTLSYLYEPSNLASSGKLTSVTSSDGNQVNDVVGQNKYDNLGRVTQTSETFQNKTYIQQYTYDDQGRIKTVKYPSQLELTYDYHPVTGELKDIRSNKASQTGYIWELISKNIADNNADSYGRYVRKITKLGNGQTSVWKYDASDNFRNVTAGTGYNNTDGTWASSIFTYSATIDPNTNYVMERSFDPSLPTESAVYDNMGNLKEIWQSSPTGHNFAPRYSYTYDITGRGNIKTNYETGAASYTYNYPTSGPPDQLLSVAESPGDIPTQDQTIAYTDFEKVKTINQGGTSGYTLNFVYGPDNQRRLMKETGPGNYEKNTYYFGNYEFETDGNGTKTIERTYIYSPDGLVAVLINEPANGGEKMYYVYTDHLGSILMLTDGSGNVVEQYSYDVWGRRRNPTTWQYYNSTTNIQPPYKLTRGYIGQEHLDRYGLINLNGRLYDPLLCRFTAPDVLALVTPDYSPYAYGNLIFNNPLSASDPTGNGGGQGNGVSGGSYGPTSWYGGYSGYTWYNGYVKSGGNGAKSGTYTTRGGNGNAGGKGVQITFKGTGSAYYYGNKGTSNGYNGVFLSGTNSNQGYTGTGQGSGGNDNRPKTPQPNGNTPQVSAPGGSGPSKTINTVSNTVSTQGGNGTQSQSADGGTSGEYIFAKTFGHYQYGLGQPLNVDASKLDLSGVTQKNLVYNSKTRTFGLDLYKVNPTSQTALALGKLTLVPQGDNTFSIQPDFYDFNIEWQNGFSKRNVATLGAGMLHNNPFSYVFGGDYWINFQGTITIMP